MTSAQLPIMLHRNREPAALEPLEHKLEAAFPNEINPFLLTVPKYNFQHLFQEFSGI